jgi:putative transposase
VLRRSIEFAQYLSIRYTERLEHAGLEPSVGTVGDSYDNALAESVTGLYKTEVIRRRGPWCDLEGVEFATWNGSTGSITTGCSNRLDTFRRRKGKLHTIERGRSRPYRHDSTQIVSGKAGAVQFPD